MADKLHELTGPEAQAVAEAWIASYPNFVDAMRNLDTLRFHLLVNPNTHWYKGATGDSYFFVTDVVRGHQALLYFISVTGAPALDDTNTLLHLFKDIMDEHALIKLMWMVPGHARRLYEAVKRCKFEIEGWLKLGCLINNRPTDLAAMSLFREDINVHLGLEKTPLVSQGAQRRQGKARRKKRHKASGKGTAKG